MKTICSPVNGLVTAICNNKVKAIELIKQTIHLHSCEISPQTDYIIENLRQVIEILEEIK